MPVIERAEVTLDMSGCGTVTDEGISAQHLPLFHTLHRRSQPWNREMFYFWRSDLRARTYI